MTIFRSIADFLAAGGIPMAPVLVTTVLVVATVVASWRDLGRAQPEEARLLEGRIDGVLFWGFFGAVLGVLGTLGGLAQMARMIQAASVAPASLVWSGVANTLPTTLVGLATLAGALPAWYLLRRRWLRLTSS
jgi:hypothetical protein